MWIVTALVAVLGLAQQDHGTCYYRCNSKGVISDISSNCLMGYRCGMDLDYRCEASSSEPCVKDTRFEKCPPLQAPQILTTDTVTLSLHLEGEGGGAVNIAYREPGEGINNLICLKSLSEPSYLCEEKMHGGSLLEQISITPFRSSKTQQGTHDPITRKNYLCPRYVLKSEKIEITFSKKGTRRTSSHSFELP